MLAFKCKFYNRLSYQWVCLELGKHQIYELDVKFDHSVITIKIIPNPNLSSDAKEQGFADSNELVRSVQRFIDDLMKEHMTVTLAKAPVVCYIPCSQCKKMHLDVEKAFHQQYHILSLLAVVPCWTSLIITKILSGFVSHYN